MPPRCLLLPALQQPTADLVGILCFELLCIEMRAKLQELPVPAEVAIHSIHLNRSLARRQVQRTPDVSRKLLYIPTRILLNIRLGMHAEALLCSMPHKLQVLNDPDSRKLGSVLPNTSIQEPPAIPRQAGFDLICEGRGENKPCESKD